MTVNDADWHFGQFMGYLRAKYIKKANQQPKEKLTLIFVLLVFQQLIWKKE
jgi:hypothetical protein